MRRIYVNITNETASYCECYDKKCPNIGPGITVKINVLLTITLKMIQLFCFGVFIFDLLIGAKKFYNNILLTIRTNDASKTRRIIFFMISRF